MTKTNFRNRISHLAVFVLLAFALPSGAAETRADLLRMVPEDAGFCLVVQDLRDHAKGLSDSPFLERFLASPLGRALGDSPEIKKLVEVKQQMKEHLGVSGPLLLDELFGDLIVLAYRVVPDAKPEAEQGLLLLHARDADLLARLVDRLNIIQIATKDIQKVEERKHKGIEYHCRFGKKGCQYYFIRDHLFAFASNEALLQEMIERSRPEAKVVATLARKLNDLGAGKALATLWINPRAFDAEIERNAAQAKPADASAHKITLSLWKSLDGIALALSLNQSDVQLTLALRAREGDLSPTTKRFFAAATKRSELWDFFPEKSLFALASQVDFVALTEWLWEFVPEEARKSLRQTVDGSAKATLGLDVIKDILPNLGPDVGLCVTAPPSSDKSLLPHVLAALKVRPGNQEKPVDKALLDGLNTLAILVLLGHNHAHPDPLSFKVVHQGKVEVKYLAGDKTFPSGVQPAFAFKDGYLLLSSAPESIRGFKDASSRKSSDDAVPILRISLRGWGAFIEERLESLTARIAEEHHISREEAGNRLQGILSICHLTDTLELSQRLASGNLTFSLRLHTEQPLRR